MTIYYVDFKNGNDANNGLSFANRKKTISSASSIAIAGDTIRIMKSDDAKLITSSATYVDGSNTLNIPVNPFNVLFSGSSWTTANVNVSTGSTGPGGGATRGTTTGGMSSFSFAAAFVTGKAAYYSFTGAKDLSGFQQISFWFWVNSSLPAGAVNVNLCSDTTGNSIINAFTINHILQPGTWHAITINYGANLGSNINSISLVLNVDPGTLNTLYISNIIACKATSATDCLTLNHVIGKNDGEWWAISYMLSNGTIGLETNQVSNSSGHGFDGTSQTTNLYAKLPIIISAPVTTGSVIHNINSSGTSGNPITISGGWDTTNMSTQTGETLLDLISYFGVAFGGSTGRQYLNVEKLGAIRGDQLNGFTAVASCTGNTWTDCKSINQKKVFTVLGASNSLVRLFSMGNASTLFTTLGTACTFDTIVIKSGGAGLSVTNTDVTTGLNFYINDITSNRNTGTGIDVSQLVNSRIYTLKAKANTTNGITVGKNPVYGCTSTSNATFGLVVKNDSLVYGLTTSGNVSGAIAGGSTADTGGKSVIYDASISESTKVVNNFSIVDLHRSPAYVNNYTYGLLGLIDMQTTTIPSGMTYAWRYSPTNVKCNTVSLALGKYDMPIARMACLSGQDNVFQFACRRSNVNLTCNLRVFGGRYPGIGSIGTDITTSVNPPVDTWQNFTITVHPTENCVIEIFFECYHNGTTTYQAYVAGPVIVS
jgi:hypothetical protein